MKSVLHFLKKDRRWKNNRKKKDFGIRQRNMRMRTISEVFESIEDLVIWELERRKFWDGGREENPGSRNMSVFIWRFSFGCEILSEALRDSNLSFLCLTMNIIYFLKMTINACGYYYFFLCFFKYYILLNIKKKKNRKERHIRPHTGLFLSKSRVFLPLLSKRRVVVLVNI